MGIKNSQRNPLILLLSGCSLFALSFFTGFSAVIFVVFVPFFMLPDLAWDLKKISIVLLLAVVSILYLAFLAASWRITGALCYGLILIVLFTSYIIAQQLTQNRLNKFSLVILWLGSEYFLLKFLNSKDPFFLADTFLTHPTWVRWNVYTGYTGASLWILLINLLIYEAVKEVKVNYFLLVLAAVAIIMPVVYSLSLSQNALTKADVIAFYSGNSTINSYYSQYGELISRTGAWVSVLIIIFTLIRVTTKKMAR